MLCRQANQRGVDPVHETDFDRAGAAHGGKKLLMLIEGRAIVIAGLEQNRIDWNRGLFPAPGIAMLDHQFRGGLRADLLLRPEA